MKINKGTFWGLLVVISMIILTLINYYSTNIRTPKEGIILSRLNSLGLSAEISGKDLKNILIGSYSENKKFDYSLLNGQYLILVLSTDGCNICFWQELEKIKNHSFAFSRKSQIKYIYFGDNKINALRFKKFMKARDTIFYSLYSKLEELNRSLKFPFVLFIKNGIVCDAHFPIPGDTTFSNLFYNRIKEKF